MESGNTINHKINGKNISSHEKFNDPNNQLDLRKNKWLSYNIYTITIHVSNQICWNIKTNQAKILHIMVGQTGQ